MTNKAFETTIDIVNKVFETTVDVVNKLILESFQLSSRITLDTTVLLIEPYTTINFLYWSRPTLF